MSLNQNRGWLVPACLAWGAIFLITISSGWAEEESMNSLRRRFEAYKMKKNTFQGSPFSRMIVEEQSTLIQWISAAETAFSEEEEELALRLVNRVQVQVRLIQTTIDELRARASVERVRQEAVQLESRARAVRSEVAALEQQIGRSIAQKQNQQGGNKGNRAAPPQAPPSAVSPAPAATPTPSAPSRPAAPSGGY
ncbi:MAG: hypothetical protein VYD19_02990 [Myxococcota bacterium]|nr:hypothetical protein [Myxococcota bacterium]